MTVAGFFFHAELNRFLAPAQRTRRFEQACPPEASIKHMIEALGVPHTEVEAIEVNDSAVDFSYRMRNGDRVDVYPYGVPTASARPVPLRPAAPARFIADAHLGQLARNLRMLGFDVLYRNDYSDADMAHIASSEGRVVLTRDRDLLIRKEIVHGCFLHATAGDAQLAQVLRRFDLARAVRAFTRCLKCNGELHAVAKEEVAQRVPPYSRAAYEDFYECRGCARVYWEGSHVARMRARLADLLERMGK